MRYLCLISYQFPESTIIIKPSSKETGCAKDFGIVGLMPVFASREKAIEFSDGQYEIVDILTCEDVPQVEE